MKILITIIFYKIKIKTIGTIRITFYNKDTTTINSTLRVERRKWANADEREDGRTRPNWSRLSVIEREVAINSTEYRELHASLHEHLRLEVHFFSFIFKMIVNSDALSRNPMDDKKREIKTFTSWWQRYFDDFSRKNDYQENFYKK